ncbi:mRNA interferase YafO [Psychrosphaera saromensis]|uniref:Toxin YafO n=1 Tax=Psychrosphaera saromensis TaxID=716813 RepID=A0A2S7URK3_9GAMM|nr:type II toxin-antitoxin system YafO family toxin [Psychrosphaera saromensis]PQJ52369.1 toxin YafO [Psychrosphaera saromensis]GHB73189.1 mRNA interferase YafO [Psychrosphaera saromensis]GLQ13468.1 mRNA interferase YafO [Psychrosphaera saromensis]
MRVFKSRLIQSVLSTDELESLVKDFKSYKSTGVVPYNFGRDVPYDHPNTMPIVKSEDVQHIHLGSDDNPLPLHKIQFHRTSDIHLVYCQGASSDVDYLLMTILSPDGHAQARSRDIMYKLGLMAKLFRDKY